VELLSVAIIIVLIGALLSIGWQLAPLILFGGIAYVVVRYRKQIPVIVRRFLREWRGAKKK